MHKKILVIFTIFSLIALMFTGITNADEGIDFILPKWGGGMVHSDPQLSDYIRLPVPKSNVEIVWHQSELSGEKAGAKGNAIAGNRDIAACTFSGEKDNLVIYDYDGNRIWTSGNLLNAYALFSAPMVDIHGRVIACDNKIILLVDPLDYDNDEKIIEWISEIPNGGLPWSPVITDDDTIIIATDRGPVYAFNSSDGSLIGQIFLGEDEKIHPLYRLLNIDDPGFFSTTNTPCVKGNRVYISTMYKGLIGIPTIRHHARLYAVDVDSDNINVDDRLTEIWNYEFGGTSQASPTLINNTVYFDGYRPEPSVRKNPHLFAITDMGSYGKLEWKVPYPRVTYASFTYDPRGGFWYMDPFGGILVRFSTENGSILETIVIDDLVEEIGVHLPSSVMTICGNDTNPVLIVSASTLRLLRSSSYIIAIDLAKNNSLMWKVELFKGPLITFDVVIGQYTVLIKNDMPRVVFGSFFDGVWAIGSKNSK